jgi:acetoacetyl-CoA synthetase
MVYGIEACGLEGKSEPFDQVEAMAQFHIEQIKRLQPNGPYFLAGYSFGGLVALQMAQRLTAAGKKIAVLALIDTYPHAKYWPLVCRFCALSQLIFFQFKTGFWSRLINHYISVLAQMPRHSAALFLVQKAYSVAKTPFDLFKLGALTHRFVDAGEIENLSLAPEGTVLPIHLQKVAEASDRAFAAYRPRFYPGQITFFKAQGAVRVPFDAKLLWGSMCRKIMVHPVPGNHRSLIIDSAKHLAESLGACIDQEFHKSRIS